MSQVPPPAGGRRSRPPARPTDQVSPRTVRGRLTRPTPGCVVVESPTGPWALVGDAPELADLAPGTEVEVTGRPAAEVDTGCGYPTLRVTSIRAV